MDTEDEAAGGLLAFSGLRQDPVGLIDLEVNFEGLRQIKIISKTKISFTKETLGKIMDKIFKVLKEVLEEIKDKIS